MARRKAKAQNHDRWLVSYADFVTLLFAFFVVLFASSTVDRSKVQRFASSFEALMRQPGASRPALKGARSPRPVSSTPEALTVSQMAPILDQLERDLAPEISSGEVRITLEPRGLVMSLSDAGFFAPGDDRLQPGSRKTLRKAAAALTRIPGEIRLEGHTDDEPIHTSRFPSNWRLSTARAVAVLRLLVREHGIEARRLAAAGFGEQRPLAPNDSAANRARNRRVDIVVLTSDAALLEPPASDDR